MCKLWGPRGEPRTNKNEITTPWIQGAAAVGLCGRVARAAARFGCGAVDHVDGGGESTLPNL